MPFDANRAANDRKRGSFLPGVPTFAVSFEKRVPLVNLTANSRALWSRNIAKKSSQNGTFTQECPSGDRWTLK